MLNADRPTRVRFVVLVWLCLAAAIAYLHRQCISVPVDQIKHDLNINNEQMGYVLAGFFLTYSLLQIPSGWLGDRWGTRRALSLFVLAWSAATAALGLAWGFVSLLAARLVGGAAQAGAFPCSVSSIARWFPPARRALPNGVLGSAMSIGAAIASSVVSFLLADVGLSWQMTLFWLSLVGVAWAMGFYWWFRDEPAEHSSVNAAELALIGEGREPASTGHLPAVNWVLLLTTPLMLLVCAQQFFRAAAHVFYQTWFPVFLQKAHGVSMEHSGYLNSQVLISYVVGALLGGWLSDRLQQRTGSKRWSRQALALVSALGASSGLLAAYFVADAELARGSITLSTFCAGLSGPVGYSIAVDIAGRHVATVFSTMNMAGNLGATACPIVVGRLVDLTGWNEVLLFMVGLYAAAGVCWLLINPEGSVFREAPDLDKTSGAAGS